MVTRRVNNPNSNKPTPQRATTPEGREQQLVALAVDVAEAQLRDGSASAQVISHFLKLGSSREHLEQERLKKEISLTDIKMEAIASQKRVEELYTEALQAMRAYSGQAPMNEPGEFDD